MSKPAQALCPVPDRLSWAQVQQVTDGDSLRLKDGRRVRLVGINAPELSRTPQPFAEAARNRLQQLVADNNGRVGLQVTGKDRYGRTLAHVYGKGATNLEAQLLVQGLGYFIAFGMPTALHGCQQAAERHAQAERLGIWRAIQIQTPSQLRSGGFALIEGRVTRVDRNRGGVWLQMDGPLVLRVDPAGLRHFDAVELSGLAGRRIRARGWVVDRGTKAGAACRSARWMLPLSAPAMLQLAP